MIMLPNAIEFIKLKGHQKCDVDHFWANVQIPDKSTSICIYLALPFIDLIIKHYVFLQMPFPSKKKQLFNTYFHLLFEKRELALVLSLITSLYIEKQFFLFNFMLTFSHASMGTYFFISQSKEKILNAKYFI